MKRDYYNENKAMLETKLAKLNDARVSDGRVSGCRGRISGYIDLTLAQTRMLYNIVASTKVKWFGTSQQ